MKFLHKSFLVSGVLIIITACKKNEIESKANPLATLITTNAVVAGGTIKLNTNDRDSAFSYNSKAFFVPSGDSKILFYQTTGNKDTYYSATNQTENGGIYSVFLFGQVGAVESIVKKENLPAYYSDSTVGIRMINLSQNSGPINLTVASATGNNLFSAVAYKQLTDFVRISLRNPVLTGAVTFQARDASNNLLASYTLPSSASSKYPNISIANSRNRNLTLVVKGVFGTATGPDAFGIFPVANY